MNKVLGGVLLLTLALDYLNLFQFSIAGFGLTKIVILVVGIILLLR